MHRYLLAMSSCLMLAGCGSGDGGPSTDGAAQPSPAPTPSASPTPSSASAPTLLTLAATTNLEGFSGSNGYYRAADGSVTAVEDYSNAAGFPVTFDGSSKQFTFQTFEYLLPDQSSTSTALHYDDAGSPVGYNLYSVQANQTSYRLIQLYPGNANPVLSLMYSSIALAEASYVDTVKNQTEFGVTSLAFGLPFDYTKVVLKGSGTYHGIILAQARGQGSTHAYEVSGDATITVNYDTTGMTGQLHLIAKDDRSGQTFDLGTTNLIPSQPRGVLDYLYAETRAGPTYDVFQARLTGPAGEEMMAGFDAHVPDPQASNVSMKLSGALVAKK